MKDEEGQDTFDELIDSKYYSEYVFRCEIAGKRPLTVEKLYKMGLLSYER